VANPDGSISLMALANFVQGTPPFDTPPPSGLPSVQPSGPGFTSMRALLEPA